MLGQTLDCKLLFAQAISQSVVAQYPVGMVAHSDGRANNSGVSLHATQVQQLPATRTDDTVREDADAGLPGTDGGIRLFVDTVQRHRLMQTPISLHILAQRLGHADSQRQIAAVASLHQQQRLHPDLSSSRFLLRSLP